MTLLEFRTPRATFHEEKAVSEAEARDPYRWVKSQLKCFKTTCSTQNLFRRWEPVLHLGPSMGTRRPCAFKKNRAPKQTSVPGARQSDAFRGAWRMERTSRLI